MASQPAKSSTFSPAHKPPDEKPTSPSPRLLPISKPVLAFKNPQHQPQPSPFPSHLLRASLKEKVKTLTENLSKSKLEEGPDSSAPPANKKACPSQFDKQPDLKQPEIQQPGLERSDLNVSIPDIFLFYVKFFKRVYRQDTIKNTGKDTSKEACMDTDKTEAFKFGWEDLFDFDLYYKA